MFSMFYFVYLVYYNNIMTAVTSCIFVYDLDQRMNTHAYNYVSYISIY